MSENAYILKLNCNDQPGSYDGSCIARVACCRIQSILGSADKSVLSSDRLRTPANVNREAIELALKPSIDRFSMKLKVDEARRKNEEE